MRVWTNTAGKTIRAEQVGLDTTNNTVSLKLENGKTTTIPLTKLSANDIVVAMQWKPPATPAEPAPFPCILGISSDDANAALGEASAMDEGMREIYEVRSDYFGVSYRDPSHPDWTAVCIFDLNVKCVELDINYTYRPKNPQDDAEFPELFDQWKASNAQGGKWVESGENTWTNDKTGAVAKQRDMILDKDGGAGGSLLTSLHEATLTIREKNWQAWKDAAGPFFR
jgi:hypothetical protein